MAIDLADVLEQDAVGLPASLRSRVPSGWPEAPTEVGLSATGIHLWLASLSSRDSSLSDCRQLLSSDELDRSQRFRYAHDRNHFIIARAFLRMILARYTNMLPAQIQFCYNRHGKPGVVAWPAETNISFNLSHSGNLALCAITRGRPIGVDIEHIRPIPEARQMAERFFSTNEKRALQHASSDQLPIQFLRFWTRREALMKAKGHGLTLPLDPSDVSSAFGSHGLRLRDDSGEAPFWLLYDLTPEPGYVATLVVGGSAACISCWKWSP